MAGLESDKTNEFLLAIAKAIDRKIDSTEAVALLKSGNVSASPKKGPKQTKIPTQMKTDYRKTSKDSKEPAGSKKVKNNVSSDKKPQKDKESNAKLTKHSSKESTEAKKLKTKSQSTEKEKEKGKDSRKEREKKQIQIEEVIKNNINGPEQVVETTTDNHQINGNAVSKSTYTFV